MPFMGGTFGAGPIGVNRFARMRLADSNTMLPAEPFPVRYESLLGYFRGLSGVLVAYSGGVDSALVLQAAVAALGPEKVLAVTAVSPSVPARDRALATETARQIGAAHRLVTSQELSRPGYRANQTDRCFHCKNELYDLIAPLRTETGWDLVVNGTNLDDLGDFRPGLEAARQAGVHSPLVLCEFTKRDVREAARAVGLAVWDRPAAPCLASRIPFGSTVTAEKLAQIERAEEALHGMGFRELRVRHHGDLARIELAPTELKRAVELSETIVEKVRSAGFRFAVLDLAGLQTGVFNPARGQG